MENTNMLTEQEEAQVVAILEVILNKLEKLEAVQLVQKIRIERLVKGE